MSLFSCGMLQSWFFEHSTIFSCCSCKSSHHIPLVICNFRTYYMVLSVKGFHLVLLRLFFCKYRRPNLKPSCIRPPLQLLPPLVWDPSTTLCLPTNLLLQASSFTPLTSSHPHRKPPPSLWPLLLHRQTRRCLRPLVLSWPTCFLAPWWTLGPWTSQLTRTCRRPSRSVTENCQKWIFFLTSDFCQKFCPQFNIFLGHSHWAIRITPKHNWRTKSALLDHCERSVQTFLALPAAYSTHKTI